MSSTVPKVHLGDLSAVKHALDQGIITHLKEKKKIAEDVNASNIKLATGFIACICAIYSYFNYKYMQGVALVAVYVTIFF